jgi:quinol-cytochrome oxidoreductase complex cytochrome b subunit
MPDPLGPDPALIERLQVGRTRMFWFLAIYFIAWQGIFFLDLLDPSPSAHTGDRARVTGYVLWAGVLLVVLATGGNLSRSREIRAILNDEGTVANRRHALSIGFYAAVIVGLGLFFATLFLTLSTREIVHAVLTAGIGSALFAFAALERRAQAHG